MPSKLNVRAVASTAAKIRTKISRVVRQLCRISHGPRATRAAAAPTVLGHANRPQGPRRSRRDYGRRATLPLGYVHPRPQPANERDTRRDRSDRAGRRRAGLRGGEGAAGGDRRRAGTTGAGGGSSQAAKAPLSGDRVASRPRRIRSTPLVVSL